MERFVAGLKAAIMSALTGGAYGARCGKEADCSKELAVLRVLRCRSRRLVMCNKNWP